MGTDTGTPRDIGTDVGIDAGPVTGLCQSCVVDDQCPDNAQCVQFGDAKLCLERVAGEFSVCPRTFEAAELASTPGRFFCLPTEGCCIDEDDDNYGQGVFCDGPDCNDMDELVHPGADELCNGDDDNCDNLADNMSIDCAMQGCRFNGTIYEQSPTAACNNGICDQVTITGCGLFSCVNGLANGDVCAGTCLVSGVQSDDYCIPAAHCELAGCVIDYPNGSACGEDTDCASEHCENGFCCGNGTCCGDDMDCPGFPGQGVICDDRPMCQGTIGSVMCGANKECATVNGAANDSGCTNSIEANNCGPYPAVFCAGGSNQSAPACATSCNVDAECDANAHCDNNLCLLNLPNGNGCDENSDCTSTHCQNGFCCASGDCCSIASNCPNTYFSASTCTDPSTCQGTRSDATCTSNQCGTVANIQDDIGCGTMTQADSCASFPSVFCNGMAVQTRPACATACTLDSQCDVGSHCDGTCVPNVPDGGVCDEVSDCSSGHCQNNFCCSSGDCCSAPTNCPASYRTPSTCGNATTCQGTRSDATCQLSVCGTAANVPDDSGCNSSSVSSNCGTFPNVTCNGATDQSAPICATSCSGDGDCDANAHCDNGQCLLDVADGATCDEDSDCTANHCQNSFCCASGDCCSTAAGCPASYRTAPTCNTVTTCQGTRVDATCTTSQCGSTTPIDDDRGCASGMVAMMCGLNPTVLCTGLESQVPPMCAAACTLDAECVAAAHCDSICVADLPNGSSCDEDSDCTASHCQNGFCCATGDCCSTANNCPASYQTSPVCNTAATCQGTRSAATCSASQCGTQANVDDDSACSAQVVANSCGFFPSVSCNGQVMQSQPTCNTGCTIDPDCDANAHCDGGVCLPDLSDGNSCDEASDCVSSHCQNNYCCSGGDCCAVAGNCPGSYAAAATCVDPLTCQGTRSDAVCSGNVCGTTANVPDDTACNAGVLANDCGPYPSRFCNGLASQVAPVCGGSCSTNANCDVDAHCRGGLCVPDLADGGSCAMVGAAACISGLCNNNFCCSGGTCCSTATDCPAAFRTASVCDNATTCQGTRSDATCVMFSCGTTPNVPDDTACAASTVANTCGSYPSVNCNGAATQSTPLCSMMCTVDGDCDANAHCDSNVCTPDLTDGSVCDELSDCITGHCQNGRCCMSGDCCSAAAQCPASYRTAASCQTPSLCDGGRNDAVCNSFICGTSAEIDDDSACTNGVLANGCGTFSDVYCNGQVSQSAPSCGTTCTVNGQCDATANCMAPNCVSNGLPGAVCTNNAQCASAHCQNGFCCASGDCCSVAANCPASYRRAAACETPSACQGTRDDAVCTALKQCTTTANIADDSACTTMVLASGCGLYSDVLCTGAVTQTAPMCGSSCTNSSQCDTGAYCNAGGQCATLRTQGQTCSLGTDCVGGLGCTDGVCCNSTCAGLCQACNVAGNLGTCSSVPNGTDPANECAGLSCSGWFTGWGGTNADQCFAASNATAANVDCNGAGSCETAAQVCPSQTPLPGAVADCDDLCQTKNLSTCLGMAPGLCSPVTPSPANMTCNSGVCTTSIARCNSGVPATCPSPMSHPSYSTETCDGLDNNCNTVTDDGGALLCSLPNATPACAGVSGCQISACTPGYSDPDGLAANGCECLPESIGLNACNAGATPIHTLVEGQTIPNAIVGNLDTGTDEDWFAVRFNNGAGEGYQPQVSFTSRANTNIVFDIRQDNCSATAPGLTGSRSGSTCEGTGSAPINISTYVMDSYERDAQCTGNTSNGTICNGAPGRTFFIRVHRAVNGPPTCAAYALTLSNGP